MLQPELNRKPFFTDDDAPDQVFEQTLFRHRSGFVPSTLERLRALFEVVDGVFNVIALIFGGFKLFQLVRQNLLFAPESLKLLGYEFDTVGVGIHFGLDFKRALNGESDLFDLLADQRLSPLSLFRLDADTLADCFADLIEMASPNQHVAQMIGYRLLDFIG